VGSGSYKIAPTNPSPVKAWCSALNVPKQTKGGVEVVQNRIMVRRQRGSFRMNHSACTYNACFANNLTITSFSFLGINTPALDLRKVCNVPASSLPAISGISQHFRSTSSLRHLKYFSTITRSLHGSVSGTPWFHPPMPVFCRRPVDGCLFPLSMSRSHLYCCIAVHTGHSFL
jgi:hypothetical protein